MPNLLHTRVIINGCFDLFHNGHRHLIKCAFKLCYQGSLLILINSDRSVKELKGEGRPIESEDQRVQNVIDYKQELNREYLEYPDTRVVIFDSEEELKELIDNFRPDMIIKGNDRPDVRTIVGSDKWPILIMPRINDENGKELSSTKRMEKQE